MNVLITAGLVAGLLTTPAVADDELKQAAEIAAFVIACPTHWNRLPPRTMRILVRIAEDMGAKHSKEVLQNAVLVAYANGYDKQGEPWCAAMATRLIDAGKF